MRSFLFASGLLAVLCLASCKKDDDPAPPSDPGGGAPTGPRLVLKLAFDSTQARLNNIGQPSTVPAGHGAQSPRFNAMSAHYVEFAPLPFTALGAGEVVYRAAETSEGGGLAIDHDLCRSVGNGEEFLNIPLSDLAPGTYTYLRVSLAYQNYDVRFQANGLPFQGTIASFIGFNTWITDFLVYDSTVAVNGNRAQGYWAFEVQDPPFAVPVSSGQAPGTTVVNPLAGTSPIPPGSCVVTGPFGAPLTITGDETEDVVIVVSLSTNKSFEWTETDGDNIWEPIATPPETVVDMGVRGMVPIVQ